MNAPSVVKRLVAVASTVVLVACSSASPNVDPDEPDPSGSAGTEVSLPTGTLGAVLNRTGFGADLGELHHNAVELAVQHLEADGIAALEIVENDAGESATDALNALRRTLSESPDAIIGPYLGFMLLAMRPEIEQAGVPTLATSGTESITQDDNEFLFRLIPSDRVAKTALAQFAVEEVSPERVAIIADNTEYGQLGADILASRLEASGANVVANETVSDETRDVAGQMQSIQSADPDAVFVQIIGGSIGATTLSGLRDAGISVPIFWSSGLVSSSFLDLVEADEVAGIYAETGGVVDPADERIQAVVADYEAAFGRTPDFSSLMVYDAVRMVGQAVAEGASGPDQVTAALRDMTFEGLLATLDADAEGNLHHEVTIVRMGEAKDPEILTTIVP